jgi:hypothetical protein
MALGTAHNLAHMRVVVVVEVGAVGDVGWRGPSTPCLVVLTDAL